MASNSPQSTSAAQTKPSSITDPLDTILSTIDDMFAKKQTMTKPFLTSLRESISTMKSNIIDFLLPLATKDTPQPCSHPIHHSPSPSHTTSKLYSTALSESLKSKQSTSSIFVKPEGPADLSRTVNQVSELLTSNKSSATLVNSSTTKNGNVVLKFKASDDVSSIAKDLKARLGLEARSRPLLKPKMTITHIPPHIKESELKRNILDNNTWLAEALDQDDDFEILFTYKPRDFISAVIKTTSIIRNKIVENQSSVVIGNRNCPAKDRFYVSRCSKCSGYGHHSSNCKSANPTCSFCSESHPTADCPHKDEPTKHTCINCKQASQNHNHPASDRKCPQLHIQTQKLIRNTDYGNKSPLF